MIQVNFEESRELAQHLFYSSNKSWFDVKYSCVQQSLNDPQRGLLSHISELIFRKLKVLVLLTRSAHARTHARIRLSGRGSDLGLGLQGCRRGRVCRGLSKT